MRYLSASLILLAFLSGCAEELASTQVDRTDTPLSQTPGVVAVPASPTPDQQGFKINDPIKIKFSGPVQGWLVEDYMLNVQNEVGQVYSTVRTWNADYSEVSLQRVVNGQVIAWDMSTTHTIKVEPYISDSYGENIWPREWDFRTEEIGDQGTGAFKIIAATNDGWITPSTWIELKFSEPVWSPYGPGVPTCSTTTWQSAFDIFIVDFLNASGNLGVPAQPAPLVCLVCNTSNVCDKLRIIGPNNWPMPYFLLNVLVVRVKKNFALRSLTSGQQLSGTYQLEKAIMIGGPQ